ncbi:MAG: hypothetical protein QOD31_2370 [Pseudonocardiales bacterium]|nr:hypothetical protein [Pseudonocardiales bacterium]
MRVVTAVLAALLLAGCTSTSRKSAPATSPAITSPGTATATPAPTSSAPAALPDWPTYHGDAVRSGVSTTMPAATGTPRVEVTLKLDGQVYASPLVVAGVTIVATENNTVYAFDQSHKQVWKRHLGNPSPAAERQCGNIDPLGITGTPVFDKASGLVFVAPEYGGPPRHELVALDVTDGSVRWQRRIDLPGVETRAMQERGALAITGGRVWVPFGGLAGDCGGYKGRVVGVALDGSGDPIAYTVPTTREAGIWTPPGPSVDASGHLFVAVGNGESGQGDPYDHSDSVLEIDTNAKLVDSFSPSTWATDNEADLDLGSQGPTLIGKWVFIAGKSGTAYVLRRGSLGGIGGQVSRADVCKSFGGTAVVGDVAYVPCTDGVRAVRIDANGQLHVLWHAGDSIAGSPVVGGGRVWALDQDAGVLHGLDPSSGKSLGQVKVGVTSRFATPALYGNRLYVPTLTGLSIATSSP